MIDHESKGWENEIKHWTADADALIILELCTFKENKFEHLPTTIDNLVNPKSPGKCETCLVNMNDFDSLHVKPNQLFLCQLCTFSYCSSCLDCTYCTVRVENFLKTIKKIEKNEEAIDLLRQIFSNASGTSTRYSYLLD